MKTKVWIPCLVVLCAVGFSVQVPHGFDGKTPLDKNEMDVNTTQTKTNGKEKELIRHKRGWGSILFQFARVLYGRTPLDKNELDVNTTQIKTNGKEKELIRHKRGWGSILFHGASILVKTTSLGITLASAITEGCSYYPSICTNKREIERLDGLIKNLTQRCDDEYKLTRRTYYDLRTATINNGYIKYYINHAMQMVENIQEREEDLCTQLELELPELTKMYKASGNYTFEQYLRAVAGQLEYRLSDIKNMLTEHKRNALLGIVVQYIIEATLNKFVKSFTTAFQTVEADDILATTNVGIWERLTNPDAPVTTKTSFAKKIKLVPKTLKQMVKNIGTKMSNFKKGIKKWGRIKSWKGFKGKLAHTFRKPINKLKTIKKFFVDPKTRANFVRGYKLPWSQKIMMGIGMAGDAISSYVTIKQWSKVSNTMDKTRKEYEEYHSKLENELETIDGEKMKMDKYWDDVIEVFRKLSQTFRSLITNATNFSNFSDVIGVPRLPVDTSSPLFTIDFDRTSKQTVKSDQLAVKKFLKSVDNDISAIENEMRAKQVLYKNTFSKSENKEPVLDILHDVTTILKFSPSVTMQDFGHKLKPKDMVCTVSILRPTLTEYDFYSLEQFRPRCEVDASTFANLQKKASSKRKSHLLHATVLNSVNNKQEKSLSKILDNVHSAYSGLRDKHIAAFGASVTDRDVICIIAKEFPSRRAFDFIHLEPFRPDCSRVTNRQFNKLMQEAAKLRMLTKGIQNDLNTCKSYGFCPCLSQVAQIHQTTEHGIESVLENISPPWKPYNGASICIPSDCGCRHL